MDPPTILAPEVTTKSRKARSIKIVYFVVFTTLVSTVASLGGGFLLYGRSIDALERVVSEVSKAQVDMLGAEVRRTLDDCEEQVEFSRKYLLGPGSEEILIAGDPSQWATVLNRAQYSAVTSSATLSEVGLELVPWTRYSPTYFYHHVWYDPSPSGGRNYVKGQYSSLMANNSIPGKWAAADVWKIDVLTGETTEPSAEFSYTVPAEEIYDIASRGKVPNMRFNDNITVAQPWMVTSIRPPAPWETGDGVVYSYSQFIKVFTAPAGHPWAGYQSIVLRAGFTFGRWLQLIEEYAKDNENTEVVLFDWSTGVIYASTSLSDILNEQCVKSVPDRWDLLRMMKNCSVNMADTTDGIKVGWSAVKGAQSKGFFKRESWYFRTSKIYEFRDDFNNSAISIGLMWYQSTVEVQKQVDEALIFLLIFAAIVLMLDALLGLAEYILVVRPLATVSASTISLTAMDIETTRMVLHAACSTICVDEVRRLTKGLLFTCDIFEEFKAFVPSTIFITNDEGGDAELAAGGGTIVVGSPVIVDGRSQTKGTTFELQNTAQITDSDSYAQTHAHTKSSSLSNHIRLNLNLSTTKGVLLQLERSAHPMVDPTAYQSQFAVLITTLQEVLSCTSGVLHPFSLTAPDVLHVSWNLSAPCGDSAFKACLTADKLKSVLTSWASCGIQNGSFTAGNIGSNTYRGFCALGAEGASSLSSSLGVSCALSRKLTEHALPTCVGPSSLEEIVRGRILCNAIALCAQSPENPAPGIYYELGPPIERPAEEWMYALASTTDHLLPILSGYIRFPASDWYEMLGGQLDRLPESLTSAQQYVARTLREIETSRSGSPVHYLRKESLRTLP